MESMVNGMKRLLGGGKADDTKHNGTTAVDPVPSKENQHKTQCTAPGGDKKEEPQCTPGGDNKKEPQCTPDENGIWKEDIVLPRLCRGRLAFALHNVYSKEECEEFIKMSEERGYVQAMVNVGNGKQVLMTNVRKSSRCVWDTPEHADEMYRRIKPYIPQTFKGHTAVGLNERLRFLRYDPGEYFKAHEDGSYMADNGDRSLITVHTYLNDGYKGGNTTFMQTLRDKEVEFDLGPDDVEFKSRTGSVLIFQHSCVLHEGSLLREGRKYTIRTEVMYRNETGDAYNSD